MNPLKLLPKSLLTSIPLTISSACVAMESSSTIPTIYQQPSITLEAAHVIAREAQHACHKAGFATVVTVVDSYSLLKAVLVSDGSFPHAIETSARKARTAASRRMPSGEVAGRNSHESTLSDAFHAIGLTSLGGGLPIIQNGQVIGGIGIAGAPGENAKGEDYDLLCIQAGLEKIGLNKPGPQTNTKN